MTLSQNPWESALLETKFWKAEAEKGPAKKSRYPNRPLSIKTTLWPLRAAEIINKGNSACLFYTLEYISIYTIHCSHCWKLNEQAFNKLENMDYPHPDRAVIRIWQIRVWPGYIPTLMVKRGIICWKLSYARVYDTGAPSAGQIVEWWHRTAGNQGRHIQGSV